MLWTSKTLGFYVLTNFFHLKINKNTLKRIVYAYLYWIFIHRIPVFLCNDKIFKFKKESRILFSWLSEGDVNDIILNKRDRHYGNMDYFLRAGFQFVYIVNGSLSEKSIADLIKHDHVLIVYRKANLFKYIFKIIKRFFAEFKTIFKSKFHFLSFFSLDFHFSQDIAEIISKNISPFISNESIVFIPYEGQPFQNYLNLIFQEMNSKVIAYMHDVLLFFPSALIKRYGHPNHIFVVGSENKNVLVKHCGWKEEEISIIQTLRQVKKEPEYFSNQFFLSYEINNELLVLELLKEFLEKNFWRWEHPEIRIHPLRKLSGAHDNFKMNVENIFKNNSKKGDKKELRSNYPLCICIGTTTVIQEALEHGIDVLHICDIPETQMCFQNIWNTINVDRINYHMAIYHLEEPSSIISYGDNKPLEKLIAKIN